MKISDRRIGLLFGMVVGLSGGSATADSVAGFVREQGTRSDDTILTY